MTPTSTPGTAGPRPRGPLPWNRGPTRRRGLLWLLAHSFPLRLLLALLAAASLLGAVNRWENCRSHDFARGCLQQDPGGVISVGNVESLSIVTAAFLYLLEGSVRRQRENLQAMEVILTCQQAGARLSHARNDALERLSSQGIWLDGLDLSRTHLEELRGSHGRWRSVNLRQASLQRARFEDADLQQSDLCDADLRGARLIHADLRHCNLRGADLRGADLRGADLRGAATAGAQLQGARLEGADLRGTVLLELDAPLQEEEPPPA